MKNLADMMKQAGQLQARMADMQKKLESLQFEGQSGGGLVKVKISGKAQVSAVEIDPSLMKPDEREILEDLLVAALNQFDEISQRSAGLARYIRDGGIQ